MGIEISVQHFDGWTFWFCLMLFIFHLKHTVDDTTHVYIVAKKSTFYWELLCTKHMFDIFLLYAGLTLTPT